MSVARHRDLLVLGAVHSHAIHGYALAEGLEHGFGKALALKRSSVYACLQRLEGRGLIRFKVKQDSAYPERRIYSTTARGRKQLAEFVKTSARRTVEPLVPLAVVVAHLDALGDGDQVTVLQESRATLKEALEQLASVPSHEGVAGAALDLLRRHYALDLEAVEALLKERASLSTR